MFSFDLSPRPQDALSKLYVIRHCHTSTRSCWVAGHGFTQHWDVTLVEYFLSPASLLSHDRSRSDRPHQNKAKGSSHTPLLKTGIPSFLSCLVALVYPYVHMQMGKVHVAYRLLHILEILFKNILHTQASNIRKPSTAPCNTSVALERRASARRRRVRSWRKKIIQGK